MAGNIPFINIPLIRGVLANQSKSPWKLGFTSRGKGDPSREARGLYRETLEDRGAVGSYKEDMSWGFPAAILAPLGETLSS